MQNKPPLVCHMGMAGLNFKHNRIDLCYRAKEGTRVKHRTFDDVMNDPILASQRLSLLKGEWPESGSCRDCKYMEEKGARSVRNNVKYSRPDRWYVDNVDPITGKMNKLHRLEFRFNNKCNYACRHCSAEYSTSWNKLIRHNPDVNEFDFHVQEENSIAQYIDLSGMIPYLDKIEDERGEYLEIEITGGEPFFQKEFYETLIMLTPYAHKIRFIVTTNGSIAGEFKGYNAVEILKPFKRTMIKFSIDGSKSFYEYFREGANWNRVSKNIQHFKDNLDVRIVCAITVSNMQSARMPEIYNDLREFCNPGLYNTGAVLFPDMLNPIHIPQPLKIQYLKECENFIDNLPQHEKRNCTKLFDFPMTMFRNNDGNEEQWDKFCRFTDRLDQIHKKNIFEYFPEWEPYWTTK